MFRDTFLFLFFAVVTKGFPVADSGSNLPSLLTINTEEELGLYSKKWNMTPVQMCTLMGHQMTIAQPLLDINHPLVSHLPSIGEMAMSDAVMICEKVLNDAKGNVATVTTVVEETRQEYSVPRDFLFDDEFEEMTDDLMESMAFTDEDMRGAMEDNTDALIELLEEQKEELAKLEEPPLQKEELAKLEEPPLQKEELAMLEEPTTKAPTIAETLGRVHSS